MKQHEINWSSKALLFFGMWLWKNEEYGHALLCMHGSQWGLKIGIQLNITWDDVYMFEENEVKHELCLHKEQTLRPITSFIKETIELARNKLPIVNVEDSIYMNYKTGKPLTSSTLNRELQRLSKKFEDEIRDEPIFNLPYKPIKTNSFEIAWALDMVRKYHYSKQVFSAVSNFMGHRTVKDTIQLLEVEPNDKIVFDYDNIGKMPSIFNIEELDFTRDKWSFIDFQIDENRTLENLFS